MRIVSRESKALLCLLPAAAAILLATVSLQWMSHGASRLSILLSWVACIAAIAGVGALAFSWRNAALAAIVLLPLWFADFNSPHQWDAVQTVVRSEVFWETGRMERFSILYPVLAPIIRIAPASSVPAHLFVMLAGLVTVLAVAAIASVFAGRNWAFRVALFIPLFPPLFLLYRWVLLDTLLVMLWSLTLLATLRWSRRLTPARAAAILLLTMATAASKEMGMLVVLPVLTGIVALAPGRVRARRLVIALVIFLVAGIVGAFVIQRYAALKNIQSYFQELVYTDRGLTFLPGQAGSLPESLAYYVKIIARQHLFFWAQTGLIVPIVFALFRPRRFRGFHFVLAVGVAAQVAWMVLYCRPDRWTDIYTYPLFDGTLPGKAIYPFLVFLALVLYHWARGNVTLRINGKTAVLLMAMLPLYVLLHLFVKAHRDETGFLHVWVAWHYPIVLTVAALPLAARGLRQLARMEYPRPMRHALVAIAFLVVLNGLQHGVGMALNFRQINMARLEAYNWMLTQPERVVYTHWPFANADDDLDEYDNGPLAWRSDGWRVSGLYQFADRSRRPAGSALFLQGVYRSYGLPEAEINGMSRQVHIVRIMQWRPGILDPNPEQHEVAVVVVRRYTPPAAP